LKKLIVLAVVFAFASGADATVLSWSTGSVTMSLSATVTVQIIADDVQLFNPIWVGNTASSIANITSIVGPPDDPRIQVVQPPSFPGWWTIEVTETLESPPTWDVTIQAGSVTGTHELYADTDILDITVVPEPMTIALLAIGSLGFLRKRRR
jgi:hypothetical protein